MSGIDGSFILYNNHQYWDGPVIWGLKVHFIHTSYYCHSKHAQSTVPCCILILVTDHSFSHWKQRQTRLMRFSLRRWAPWVVRRYGFYPSCCCWECTWWWHSGGDIRRTPTYHWGSSVWYAIWKSAESLQILSKINLQVKTLIDTLSISCVCDIKQNDIDITLE